MPLAPGGSQPKWSRDGQELFYRNGDFLMSGPIESGATELTFGTPQPLFEGRFDYGPGGSDGDGGGINYDVTPDGEHFVMLQLPEVGSSRIIVVLNWTQELLERVPIP